MGNTLFREQYLDAVAAAISDQEMAGMDILTDGDSRFDLEVGGKSWFFYVLERLRGIQGSRNLSPGWSDDYGIRPGHILYEVQEAYQPPVIAEKLSTGPFRLMENSPKNVRKTNQVWNYQLPVVNPHGLERVLPHGKRTASGPL